MKKSIIEQKSYDFALRIIKLHNFLTDKKKEFILSRQILRCGTSIGANVKEGVQAESKTDFVHKISIALKEASETDYWLNLLKDSEIIDNKSFESISKDCIELIKIMTAINKTSAEILQKSNSFSQIL